MHFLQQKVSLASSIDIALRRGLKMCDLTAILTPLEEILTQGVLSLLHCKVFRERMVTMALTHLLLAVVPKMTATSNLTVQLECSPTPKTQPAHKTLA